MSDNLNFHNGFDESCCLACLVCFVSTRFDMSGKSRSKRDLRRRPMSSDDGETSVVDCGVILYVNRNLERSSWRDDPAVRFNPCFTV